MTWYKYPLIFRLESPLHIGYRKVGNLMQTRGYVPGKAMWAALTARLTRDSGHGAEGSYYKDIGQMVNESFRFGYLYPALPRDTTQPIKSVDDLTVHHPWKDNLFDYRFLDSYASTTLDYDHQAAAEGLLHEVEFIRPRARPLPGNANPPQVYLVGDLYVWDKLDSKLAGWHAALSRIQLGGERGYGWGRLHLTSLSKQETMEEPAIEIEKDKSVLAHVQAQDANLMGPVEPLVGWERDNDQNGIKNWRLSSATICYAPGAMVKNKATFTIGYYGIWQPGKIKL